MLISEFVKRLNKIQEEHGDFHLVFQTQDRNRHTLSAIVHETEYAGDLVNKQYCLDLTMKCWSTPM